MKKIAIILGLFAWKFSFFLWAQSSPFATGTWHKLEVQQNGVYKISANMLRAMGYNLATLNPQHLQIWGSEGGMLPQANALPRKSLDELAILVVGEDDGRLDNQDYILFYAEGADKTILDGQILRIEKNLYDTKNYYFLTVGNQKGKRIQTQPSAIKENVPMFTTYHELYHHETERNNALARLNNGQGAGRLWIGEELNNVVPNFTLNLAAEGIATNGELRLQASLLAQAYQQSSGFQLNINGVNIGDEIRLSPVSSLDPYLPKARHTVVQRSLALNQIPNPSLLRLTLTYRPNTQGGIGFIDYLTLNYPRRLQLYGQQTIFRNLESLSHKQSSFFLNNPPAGLRIWDVTDFFNVKHQLMENNRWTFSSESLRTFVAFQDHNLPEPRWLGQLPAQNLSGLPPCDFLIIAHERFWNEAQRLAQFRRHHDGLNVHLVTPTQIYHEFSSGRQDVTAIRDFIRHLYQKGQLLRYVLLFGDASYDYLNRVQGNTNFVPVYQARESLDPINAYSSEDFYGMMDEHEGYWEEIGNLLPYDMEVGVGRLPVSSMQEARAIVDKLIHYATAKTTLGDWRKRIVFVADDGDGNTHQEDAELLAKIVESKQPSLNVEKIYIDAFPKESTGAKEISPLVKQRINETAARGALVLNYTGHGAETGWASENILDNPQVSAWQNLDRLPIFITATCEYGRYDNPLMRSGAEYALFNPNGGAIALLTTTRPVYAFSNFQLNQALYQIAFPLLEDNDLRLGDLFKITKNNSVIGVKNRNFALLGDPSMRIAYPRQEVVLKTLNGKQISSRDTLKALSEVRITGEITYQSQRNTLFNGDVMVIVYDKKATKSTLGNSGNTRMTYQVQENMLFNGKATVRDGQFEFSFVVPKNIDYRVGLGKISLYALDGTQGVDAKGSLPILIGGTADNPQWDTKPPLIDLYVENESFTDGDIVPQNTTLFATLKDESGINTTGIGIGHDLIAFLNGDENQMFVLNNFYVAARDTYKQGSLQFPLQNLPTGEHTLTLRAWDTFNNMAEKTISFVVAEKFIIKQFNVYPHPIRSVVYGQFEHNQAGERLFIRAMLFSLEGAKKEEKMWEMFSTSSVCEFSWELPATLPSGIYMARVEITTSHGLRAQQSVKLVVVN